MESSADWHPDPVPMQKKLCYDVQVNDEVTGEFRVEQYGDQQILVHGLNPSTKGITWAHNRAAIKMEMRLCQKEKSEMSCLR